MAEKKANPLGFIIIAIIVFMFTRNCDNKSEQSKSFTGTSTSSEQKANLELMNWHWERGEYGTYIVGIVKNNANKTYGYAQVSFNLYDEHGNQVGSTLANINNLEPYGTWKFKAIVTEDNVKRAAFKEITAF